MELMIGTVVVAMRYDGIRGTETLLGQMTECAAFRAQESVLDNSHATNVVADGRKRQNPVTPSSHERNIEPFQPSTI